MEEKWGGASVATACWVSDPIVHRYPAVAKWPAPVEPVAPWGWPVGSAAGEPDPQELMVLAGGAQPAPATLPVTEVI